MTKEEFIKASEKKHDFIFDLSWYEEFFRDTTDEEFGKIMRAVCEFTISGELQDLQDRGLNVIARAMRAGIEKRTESYIIQCAQRRENGRKGGKAKAENQRQNDIHDDWDSWAEDMQRLRMQKGGTF